jgi:hypothetical protein
MMKTGKQVSGMGGSWRRSLWGMGALLLGVPAAGLAVWEDVGPLVSDPAYDAQGPSIADNPAGVLTPYVALSQNNGANYQVLGKNYVANWLMMAAPLNNTPGAQALAPDMAVSMLGTPYVTWIENPPTRVWVSRYVGGIWSPLGTSGNIYGLAAWSPRLAIADQTPYVTWTESNGTAQQVVVRHISGAWVTDSPTLNISPGANAYAPDIQVTTSGSPVVTWYEEVAGQGTQVFVRHHDGAGFVFYPGAISLNIDPMRNASHPRLAVSGDTPYVTWDENVGSNRQVYVKYHNGTDWELISPPLNVGVTQDAYAPDIALLPGPIPIVAWCEYNGNTTQVYVKQFQTAAIWNPLAASLNVDINRGGRNPDIMVMGDEPYVVWEENAGLLRFTHCRRWRTPTPTFTPTRTATPFATNTFTSTVSPTRTGTITVSPSPTPSPTWTGTITVSPSPTASPTRTGTITVSPSPTASPTRTGTITVSPSPTGTWTSTVTPTFTATLTVSATNTVVIFTPTFTPTPSATPTRTQSATVTLTGTRTSTPTMTLTRTVTLTPTPVLETPTFTATRTRTITVTPAGTTATATFTPVTPVDRTATPTATLHVVSPSHTQPVVIRGNVYRPTQQPPLTITVYLDEAQEIKIQVFTQSGKLVKTIVDEMAAAGTFAAVWNGANREGQVVRSGVYIVNVETRQFRENRKLVVVR